MEFLCLIAKKILKIISFFFFQVTTQVIASFQVPRFVGKWTRFAFRVSTENITLFFNCNESDTVMVFREPLELVFDSASTLYIAQAGPIIQEPYEVSVLGYESRYVRNGIPIRRLCRAILTTLRAIYIKLKKLNIHYMQQ